MNKIMKRLAKEYGTKVEESIGYEKPEDSETAIPGIQPWNEVKDSYNRKMHRIPAKIKAIDTLIKDNNNQEQISMHISDIIDELYELIDEFTSYNNSFNSFE